VSEVEILNYLKKSLGVITRLIEEKGVVVSFPNHAFAPEVEVTDAGSVVSLGNAVLLKLKNLSNHPCFFNLDRPVTSYEYGVVPPMSYYVVARRITRVFLRAPLGHRCVVKIDALVV